MTIDNETVETLRKSKALIGSLLPVVRDQEDNIISGRHGKYADANWPEVQIEAKDPLGTKPPSIHYNVQHKPPREETKLRVLRIAKLLEARCTPKDEIAAKVLQPVPYSSRYVRSCCRMSTGGDTLNRNQFRIVKKRSSGLCATSLFRFYPSTLKRSARPSASRRGGWAQATQVKPSGASAKNTWSAGVIHDA